jgi:hypothetical protein
LGIGVAEHLIALADAGGCDPKNGIVILGEAPCFAMGTPTLGRRSESAIQEAVAKYRRILPGDIAYAMTYRGEIDRAFELLGATNTRNFDVAVMADHAVLEPLHSDPRWLPFFRKLGMSPEQLAAIKFDVKVPQ